MSKKILGLLLTFLCLPAIALERLDFKYGYISDNARIIDNESYEKINNVIEELKEKTTAEIAVVTLNSLQGKSIEDTAVEIGRKYKVGAKNVNNGVVIVVATKEREVRLEVGMGLEAEISNSTAQTIVDSDMLPYFSQEEYSKGIHRGVVSTAEIIAQSYDITLDNTTDAPPKISKNKNNEDIPFWAWPIIILLALFRGGRGSKFGGGGGFSGGRGATGRW